MDFPVFIGDFDGHSVINSEGEILDQDVRDWKIHENDSRSDSKSRDLILSYLRVIDTGSMSAIIQWGTPSENDLLGFNVFRSETTEINDGSVVNQVIIPASNTDTANEYEVHDHSPILDQESYYFIAAITLSGGAMYAGPAVANIDGQNGDDNPMNNWISSWPNPFTTSTTLRCDLETGNSATVVIFDKTRDRVIVLSEDVPSGLMRFDIDAETYNLEPGLYRVFLSILDSDGIPHLWSYGDIMYDPDFEW